jgi:hypothetical protein
MKWGLIFTLKAQLHEVKAYPHEMSVTFTE